MSDDKKKAGGVFAIEDEQVKWEMLEINAAGRECPTIDAFMQDVFSNDRHKEAHRFVVCFMPAGYEFDLENESGAASPMDAAQAYISLITEGFSVHVWDSKTKLSYYTEQNEYIYEPMIEAGWSMREPKKIVQAMPDETLIELRKLIDEKLGPQR